jgi:hypothetical protein
MDLSGPDRLQTYRNAYEALDVCQTLEMVLSRLRQQQMLDEAEWTRSAMSVAEIKVRVEGHLTIPQ